MRMTPEVQATNFRRQLDFVGNPLGLDPAGLQTLRIAAAAALGAISTAIGLFIGTPFVIGLSIVIGVALGFYLPVIWLDQLVRDRRSELEASLPNALDVVAISMEAGLGLDRALEQLVRHQDDSLTLLVARALREIQLGRPRHEALEETDLEDHRRHDVGQGCHVGVVCRRLESSARRRAAAQYREAQGDLHPR